MNNQGANIETLKQQLTEDLIKVYGPLLHEEQIQRALGYQTRFGFRKAMKENSLPIEVFSILNRRGKYALAKDIAGWLAESRLNIVQGVASGSTGP